MAVSTFSMVLMTGRASRGMERGMCNRFEYLNDSLADGVNRFGVMGSSEIEASGHRSEVLNNSLGLIVVLRLSDGRTFPLFSTFPLFERLFAYC